MVPFESVNVIDHCPAVPEIGNTVEPICAFTTVWLYSPVVWFSISTEVEPRDSRKVTYKQLELNVHVIGTDASRCNTSAPGAFGSTMIMFTSSSPRTGSERTKEARRTPSSMIDLFFIIVSLNRCCKDRA